MREEEQLGVDRYIDWLQLLPEGSEVIWYSRHMDADRPYTTGWVDVNIPEFELHDGGMAWTMTIVHDDDPDLNDPAYEGLCWAWPTDLPNDGGWTADAVTRCLGVWAAENADRPDLRFVWTPEWDDEFSRRLNDRMKEIESGAVEPMLFNEAEGRKIHIHPDVFDFFLSLGEEERADISKAISTAIINDMRSSE